MDMFVSAAARAAVPGSAPSQFDISAALMAAAHSLLDPLARGQAIDTAALRAAVTTAFGGSDAEGAWDWKTAYDAGEAATVLFLRKFGRGMRGRAGSAAALLAMLAKVAALLPSHTRRSEESQALQQFSTPITLGFAAATAAAITPVDLVLEPSAGTGLLAIFAELAGSGLVLNELADGRARLLGRLFADFSVTQYDAAHIHDHLDATVRPSVVLMNPPFSVAAHVDGTFAGAAFRHLSSAFARLAEGGRLVAITGTSLSPDNPSWRDAFVRLQERERRRLSNRRGESALMNPWGAPLRLVVKPSEEAGWTCCLLRRHRWPRLRTAWHGGGDAPHRDRPGAGRRSNIVSAFAWHGH
jgi:predicted RNA methylase